jgi:hypothetical protein
MEFGRIYKIVSEQTDKIYIGSTVKTLSERLESHETDYEKWFCNNFKRTYYYTSFEILKYGDYKIILLEEYPCSCTNELTKREGYYQIKQFNICVNSLIAGGRPKISKIDDNEFYTCYCGEQIQNIYKTRYKHTKSYCHKKKIKETHIEMIKDNPKFEIIHENM